MHRAALVLCALVAAAAGGLLGAPVPFPRPGLRGPWVKGWDQPVNPLGGCRFHRSGDRLTITVPGNGHELDACEGRLNAPCLLRDVRGDFRVQVRVEGRGLGATPVGEAQRAGILVTDGNVFLLLKGHADEVQVELSRYRGAFRLGWGKTIWGQAISVEKPIYLRIERRGQDVSADYSLDGKEGTPTAMAPVPHPTQLKHTVKVGVFAECTAPGTFKAVFDQWKLTPLGRLAQ